MKPDHNTPAPNGRPTLVGLCQQNRAEPSPVIGRLLAATGRPSIDVAAFGSSV